MYQVLIIEDDPMVASIDRKYVEMTPGFQVLDTIPDGSRALDSPLLAKADLIILDYFMPRMNGDEFIDRMHHAGHTPSVIMVTSANDSGIVTSLLSRGVTDYLVKPFEYDRFRDALLRFERQNRQRNCSRDSFDQEEIDRLIRGGGLEKPSTKPPEELAKGLNQATLDGHHPQLPVRPPRRFLHVRPDCAQGIALPHHRAPLRQLSAGAAGSREQHRLPDRRPAGHVLPIYGKVTAFCQNTVMPKYRSVGILFRQYTIPPANCSAGKLSGRTILTYVFTLVTKHFTYLHKIDSFRTPFYTDYEAEIVEH